MSGSKEPVITSLQVTASKENYTDGGGGRLRVERDKEVKQWNEQKMPKALLGYSGGMLPGRSTKERGREGEEDSRERQVREETAQEVVAGIEKKASALENAKPTTQEPVGQNARQDWDCSQIEDRYEGEIFDWYEEDQWKGQWEEDEKMEEFLEQKRVDGGAWHVEAMQKVPELVAHRRISQCKRVEG